VEPAALHTPAKTGVNIVVSNLVSFETSRAGYYRVVQ